jgi:site-specific recombinase XerC
VAGWWAEAKARGLKPSTHESYRLSAAALIAFLHHEDAARVTPDDVLRFKDHRLAFVHPRTGRPISAKTVNNSDLAGLKAIFGWAVANRKLPTNPAAGITIKVGKPVKLRSKGFTDDEARAILTASLKHQPFKQQKAQGPPPSAGSHGYAPTQGRGLARWYNCARRTCGRLVVCGS